MNEIKQEQENHIFWKEKKKLIITHFKLQQWLIH